MMISIIFVTCEAWNNLKEKTGAKRKYQTKLINDVVFQDSKGKWKAKTSSPKIEKIHKRFKTQAKEESQVGQPEWKILFYFNHDMAKLDKAVEEI